jgi:hypothetical protein
MVAKTEIVAGPTGRVWFALFIVVGLLSVFVVWKAESAARKMAVVTASSEQDLSRRAAGSQVKFVLEISEASPAGKITGKLLQKKTEEIYLRTATEATVHTNEQTKIVMGKAGDIRAGAIVHVTGTLQKDRRVSADQVVILTGFVELEQR